MGKIAFVAALLSLLLFLSTIVLGAAGFPGYSHVTHYISELGANGAPHGQVVSLLGFIPAGIALMVFAFTAPRLLPRSAWTWLGFTFIGYYAFGLVAGGLFPCDFGCRPDHPSATQMIHDLMAGTGYLTGITALLVLGIQARRWPRGGHLLPLGIVCWAVAALALPWLYPDSGHSGLGQRIVEACMYAWILACAFHVRRKTGRETAQGVAR